MSKKIIVGKEEWCSLPDLNLNAIKARIDSGAKTSSLHAFNIQPYKNGERTFVSFEVHPIQNNREIVISCHAEVLDKRNVKSSSGDQEKRYVIGALIKLGNDTWQIEITLTNRDSMGYRMLIGREAMKEKILIDPDDSFCLGEMSASYVHAQYKDHIRSFDGLNIVLLASNPKLYSNQRIIEAGEERGHKMIFANLQHSYMNISSSDPKIHLRGNEVLEKIDAVIPRIKPSLTFYGCSIVRQFQSLGVFCLNNSTSITQSRDKLKSLQLLSVEKLPMPTTGFAHSPVDTSDVIAMVGGAPLVIKLLEGTQGKGVVLAETSKAAESVINAFKSLNANILVQEFIKEADGKDIRCFVVEGRVIGSIQRQSAEGEFRANLHLGGTASAIKITPEEKRIAIKAAKAMGLMVAGVDIIRSKTGPKILEINSSPGLQGIEEITEKDIAGLMIECIENNLRKADAIPQAPTTHL